MQNLSGLQSIVLVITVVVLVAALLSFFVLYRRLALRLKAAGNERDELKKNVAKNSEVVIEDAHKQAMLILQHAQQKAQELLSNTKQFQVDAKRILETELKDITSTQSAELQQASTLLLKNYEESLNTLKTQDINLFKNITEAIEKDVTEEMKDFKVVLQKETVASEKMVQEKVNEQFSTVKSEIDEYKKQQIARVDEHILELLKVSTSLILQKNLSLEDHQNIVLDALAEAKKNIS